MPRTYERAPIAEAVCSFRFESSAAWDWTIPGLMYSRIKSQFPTKREYPGGADSAPEEEAAPSESPTIERMQFVSPDESTVVQVGPNQLAVNRLSAYPGWPEFRRLALRQLNHYLAVAGDTKVIGVAVGYMNRIVVPSSEFVLDDYFLALPGLPDAPEDVEAEVGDFYTDTTVNYRDPPLSIRIRFGTATGGGDDESRFTMNLDASSVDTLPATRDALPALLDSAHDRIEELFDASFTEKAHKELFGEASTAP